METCLLHSSLIDLQPNLITGSDLNNDVPYHFGNLQLTNHNFHNTAVHNLIIYVAMINNVFSQLVLHCVLTHSSLDKMVAIVSATFSTEIVERKFWYFYLNFIECCFKEVQLTGNQYWFRQWLNARNTHQGITWTNDDPLHLCIPSSL